MIMMVIMMVMMMIIMMMMMMMMVSGDDEYGFSASYDQDEDRKMRVSEQGNYITFTF